MIFSPGRPGRRVGLFNFSPVGTVTRVPALFDSLEEPPSGVRSSYCIGWSHKEMSCAHLGGEDVEDSSRAVWLPPKADTRRPTQTAPERQNNSRTAAARGRASSIPDEEGKEDARAGARLRRGTAGRRLVCRRRGGGGRWRVWTGAGCGRGSEA